MTTLDNQSSYVQIGRRAPRVTSKRSDKSVNIAYENVGLIVGATPRIAPDGMVTMEIDFEKSDLGNAAEGQLAPPMEVIRVQTTVSVPDGQTLILGGLVAESGNKKHELLMVVTPRIITVE
jgi:general secretion pathway protein D